MKNSFLKLGIVVCLLFCALECGKFIYSRVPPFSVGECHQLKDAMGTQQLIIVKIVENHLLEGYSDVEVLLLVMTTQTTATFDDLRRDIGEKVNCQ